MPARPFQQVDVFTATPTRGNPVAVVLDAAGIEDEQMQAVARWTNLSETTFVLPPTHADADYRVRIFTPSEELPFAGHPTLGTCHAWLTSGGRPRQAGSVVQECLAGLVRLRQDATGLAFAAPPSTRADVDHTTLAPVVAALGLTAGDVRQAQLLDNGVPWLTLLLADAATVLALDVNPAGVEPPAKIGVLGPHSEGGEAAIEVRAFVVDPAGITEDPVTGSLQASAAQWLIETGELPDRYVAAQGTRLGRLGRAHLERADGEVWVGGGTHTVVDGTIEL